MGLEGYFLPILTNIKHCFQSQGISCVPSVDILGNVVSKYIFDILKFGVKNIDISKIINTDSDFMVLFDNLDQSSTQVNKHV